MEQLFKRVLIVMLTITLITSGCGKGLPFGSNKGQEADDLIGLMGGGFFYTPLESHKEMKTFIEERTKAITVLRGTMLDMLPASQSLATSCDSYESDLLDYTSQLLVQDEAMPSVKTMMDQMIAYKTGITTHITLLKTYKESNPSNEAEQSVLDGYTFESVDELNRIFSEYIYLLDFYSQLLASYATDATSEGAMALENMQSSQLDQLHMAYAEYMVEHAYVLQVYQGIISADYYADSVYLNLTKAVLADLEQTEDVISLTAKCDALIETRTAPNYLIQVSYDQIKPKEARSKWLSPLIMSVHADDTRDLSNAIAAVQYIKTDKMNPDTAYKNIKKNASIIQEHLSNQPPEILAAYGQLTPVEMFEKYNLQLYELANPSSAPNDSNEPTPIQTAAEAEKDRQDAINKLLKLQMYMESASGDNTASKFISFFTKEQSSYGALINQLAKKLKENEGSFSNEEVSALEQLLNNDMEELLGDQKEHLVNILLENKAEELVGVFNEWKNKTNGFKNFDFTMEDVQITLGQLGVTEDELDAVIGQVFLALSDEEVATRTEGFIQMFDIGKIIREILTALFGGLVSFEEDVENGNQVRRANDGSPKRTQSFVDSKETTRTTYFKRDGLYRVDSYRHTIYDENQLPLEEFTFIEGEKTEHTYFGVVDGVSKELHTDYYENGRVVNSRYYYNVLI